MPHEYGILIVLSFTMNIVSGALAVAALCRPKKYPPGMVAIPLEQMGNVPENQIDSEELTPTRGKLP